MIYKLRPLKYTFVIYYARKILNDFKNNRMQKIDTSICDIAFYLCRTNNRTRAEIISKNIFKKLLFF